jgi:hypothetical protein
VVGLDEAGVGGGDSSGAQGVEGGRGVVWDHAAFHKAKAVREVPRRLEAEGKISSLVGWHYIRRALNALPS